MGLWLCSRLQKFAVEAQHPNWIVVTTHVEKVKSFAPNVNHYVADVFVGPAERAAETLEVYMKPGSAGMMREDRTLELSVIMT